MQQRIAIVVHVYYPELWDELARCISNFKDYAFDLFVTCSGGGSVLEDRIRRAYPMANVRRVSNRGYDVAPFLSVIGSLDLSKYDYVVKLHTKRSGACWVNYLPFFSTTWRRRLLSFCSSRRAVERTLRFLAVHPKVGMVSHPSLIVGRGDFQESESVMERAEEIVRDMRLIPRVRQFVAGTMFICRSECLRPLHGHSAGEFEESAGDAAMSADFHVPGLAHVYERVFGYLVRAEDYRIADVNGLLPFYVASYWLRVSAFYVFRFLFRCTLKPLLRLARG